MGGGQQTVGIAVATEPAERGPTASDPDVAEGLIDNKRGEQRLLGTVLARPSDYPKYKNRQSLWTFLKMATHTDTAGFSTTRRFK